MDQTPWSEAGTWVHCMFLVMGIVFLIVFGYLLRKGIKSKDRGLTALAAVLFVGLGGGFFGLSLWGLLAF